MLSFWRCQRNLIKTFQNEANTPLITKITLKFFWTFSFEVIRLAKITIWWRHLFILPLKFKLDMNSPKRYEIIESAQRVRYIKFMKICHLMCFNHNYQGEMLSLRVFTTLANQKVVVLLIPVFSPLCMPVWSQSGELEKEVLASVVLRYFQMFL